MDSELSTAERDAVLEHVLQSVHPDRLEAAVVGTRSTSRGTLVGVKVHPRGYLSTAKYALATVADGAVVDARACTSGELRSALGGGGT